VAEKKNREGAEDKERNDDHASRHRVSLRSGADLSFYMARAGMKRMGKRG
jgi:hypothetical protein